MEIGVSEVLKNLQGKPIRVKLEKVWSMSRNKDDLQLLMQGGGTDGTYGYYALVTRGDSATAMSYIHKVDLKTWQTVAVSKPLPLNHANDISYDPKHRRLVVSHCDIYPDRVSFIDPDTLELLETRSIPQNHYSMAYNANKGLYVAGKSRTYDLALLDDDFRPVRLLPGEDGHVKQGLECDDDFIYFFQTGIRYNWIFVFDWEGAFLGKIPVPMVGESENLFVFGDGFIGAFNNNEDNTADLYRMTLEEDTDAPNPAPWWSYSFGEGKDRDIAQALGRRYMSPASKKPEKEEVYIVNQLGYPHVRYEHNVDHGGVIPERRNIATSGCGVCSACMVVGNLTGYRLGVEECAKISVDCGANRKVGTQMRILGPEIARRYQLAYSHTNDPQEMLACLEQGGLVIANVAAKPETGKGIFTDRGHYIVVLSAQGDELCILDPAYQFGKFDRDDRRDKVRVDVPFLYCSLETLEEDVEIREIHYYLFKRL